MNKQSLKRVAAALAVCILPATFAACGCGGDVEADLVFVNNAEIAVSAVLLDWQDQSEWSQHAYSSPLNRGESFGFEAGKYPVTVEVYAQPGNGLSQEPLAELTISQAPAEGERWYVTARDSTGGLTLEVDTVWPDGV